MDDDDKKTVNDEDDGRQRRKRQEEGAGGWFIVRQLRLPMKNRKDVIFLMHQLLLAIIGKKGGTTKSRVRRGMDVVGDIAPDGGMTNKNKNITINKLFVEFPPR